MPLDIIYCTDFGYQRTSSAEGHFENCTKCFEAPSGYSAVSMDVGIPQLVPLLELGQGSISM